MRINKYQVIDGIKCYSPSVKADYKNYPKTGFDVVNEISTKSFWVNSRNRLFKKLIFSILPRGKKTNFLEIGCGVGDLISVIYNNSQLNITGSEIYIEGLKIAKNRYPDVSFIQYDVTEGHIDKTFDIIGSFDVLEHINNDNIALKNINKMLSKNGYFIISVPQHMFLWSKIDEIVKHKRRYSRKELYQKLLDSGFTVTYVTSFLFFLFPLMFLQRILDRKFTKKSFKKNSLKKRTIFPGVIDKILDLFMRLDEALINFGVSLPFGGTLVMVARKSNVNKKSS